MSIHYTDSGYRTLPHSKNETKWISLYESESSRTYNYDIKQILTPVRVQFWASGGHSVVSTRDNCMKTFRSFWLMLDSFWIKICLHVVCIRQPECSHYVSRNCICLFVVLWVTKQSLLSENIRLGLLGFMTWQIAFRSFLPKKTDWFLPTPEGTNFDMSASRHKPWIGVEKYVLHK